MFWPHCRLPVAGLRSSHIWNFVASFLALARKSVVVQVERHDRTPPMQVIPLLAILAITIDLGARRGQA